MKRPRVQVTVERMFLQSEESARCGLRFSPFWSIEGRTWVSERVPHPLSLLPRLSQCVRTWTDQLPRRIGPKWQKKLYWLSWGVDQEVTPHMQVEQRTWDRLNLWIVMEDALKVRLAEAMS